MLNKAYIDLRVLKQNALKIKRQLKKGVLFNAVVKANGYGHGAVSVANAIYSVVDGFSVALVEEGVQLRLAGIKKEILLLIPPLKEELELAIENQLVICVDSLEKFKQVEKASRKLKSVAIVHIKVNTGMNRLGVDAGELVEIFEFAKKCSAVKIEGIFSHLACPEKEKETKSQVNKFLLAKNVAKRYNNKIRAHLSASGGFIKGYHFDMVRIGILLYGYQPFENQVVKVKPIMKIYSPILSERRVKKGKILLYGNKRVKEETCVTLVRVGYADGFLRKESQNLFNNRCMDVSAYKKVKKSGRYALVLDNASCLASSVGTISYEVLAKSAIRAQKIYKN